MIVDFITKLSLVAGKNMILVIYNRLSKITYFVVIMKGISAKELVRLFRDNMWKLYEFLESIVLNRRLQFVAKLTKELKNIRN